MEIKEINFRDIENEFNDNDSLIVTNFILNENVNFKMMENLFNQYKLFGIHRGYILDVYKITGNINGSRGRQDILLHLSCETIMPQIRLEFSKLGVIWTSDFLTLYNKDYFK